MMFNFLMRIRSGLLSGKGRLCRAWFASCSLALFFGGLSDQLLIAQNLQSHPALTKSIKRIRREFVGSGQKFDGLDIVGTARTLQVLTEVPIWLDCDVAKDFSITGDTNQHSNNLSAQSIPPDYWAELQRIAEAMHCSLLTLDEIVVMVPVSKRELYEYNWWQLKSKEGSLSWQSKTANLKWPQGATTRSITEILNQEVNLPDGWENRIPHDLWGEFEFQNTPYATLVTCILSSLNQVIRIDQDISKTSRSSRPEIVVQPAESFFDSRGKGDGGATIDEQFRSATLDRFMVKWVYSGNDIKALGTSHCREWKERNPATQIVRNEDGAWEITALPSQHRDLVEPIVAKSAITNPSKSRSMGSNHRAERDVGVMPATKGVANSQLSPNRNRMPPKRESRYTGVMQGTFGQALGTLSQSLKLTFSPSVISEEILAREVRVEYKEVTLAELLEQLAKEAQVRISPMGDSNYSIEDHSPSTLP